MISSKLKTKPEIYRKVQKYEPLHGFFLLVTVQWLLSVCDKVPKKNQYSTNWANVNNFWDQKIWHIKWLKIK